MDGIEDDLFQMDSFNSSDNNFEDHFLKKVQESFRKRRQGLLTAVLTRTQPMITPQITIARDFRYCVMPEYLVFKFLISGSVH